MRSSARPATAVTAVSLCLASLSATAAAAAQQSDTRDPPADEQELALPDLVPPHASEYSDPDVPASEEQGGARDADTGLNLPRARAREPRHVDVTFSAWTRFFGAGVWSALPVLDESLLPGQYGALEVEGGLLVLLVDPSDTRYLAVAPLGGVRWLLPVNPEWSAFVTLKVGFEVPVAGPHLNIVGGSSFGAYYRTADETQLRLEAGYPGGLQVGLHLPF